MAACPSYTVRGGLVDVDVDNLAGVHGADEDFLPGHLDGAGSADHSPVSRP
jgi:hypothetical protein